jgi:hypothetical protein
MIGEARDSFLRAEELTAQWPEELAFIYFNHALFVLDLGAPQDLETALRYLELAAAQRDQAIAAGLGSAVERLTLAIRLNRADALSQLGRLDAADLELTTARRELRADASGRALAKIRLVEGFVAARRRDLATAEARFAQADDGTFDGDFRWRMALELARMHRSAGALDRAESAYRTAIAAIEALRRDTDALELRPWVLARRTLPHTELLELLVEQGRGVDALAIAESLHARAWLDVVLDRAASGSATAEQALTAARVRQRLSAVPAPSLAGPELLDRIGDREALVYVTAGATMWRGHVARGRVRFVALPADTGAAVRAFRMEPGDEAAAERAAAALLPADLAASAAPLFVIAHGPLADVPFAALRVRGRHLVELRSIGRLPGLAALRCAAPARSERSVVIGDSRGDLPEAAREAHALAASLGVPALVGAAATRRALAPARGAALLHLAVHGVATSAGRAFVLADGPITAGEILEAGLDPELVFLSGCATSVGDDAESWGGFPSAFLAAGSRYIVATLRSVEDHAAARVTTAYYAQPASLDPVERLAAAQRSLAAVLPVAAWASFVAWGTPACAAE